MTIYEVSEKLRVLGGKIKDFSIHKTESEQLKIQLNDLSGQCTQLSGKIIRDHAEIGIAQECYLQIIMKFNFLVLTDT